MITSSPDVDTTTPPITSVEDRLRSRVPGLLALAVATCIALAAHALWAPMSALLAALLLGVLVTNVRSLPTAWAPGLKLGSGTILRLGIVLLGLTISVKDIAGLGLGMILVIVIATSVTFGLSSLVGPRLGLSREQSILVAAGCSICGAAAVAGFRGSVKAKDDEVAAAVGVVVIFGSLSILVVPLVGRLIGLPAELFGDWAGASVHEVAQVVAVGGTMGTAALTTAVVVKLTRVLMLAPLVAVTTLLRGRSAPSVAAGSSRRRFGLPAVVPWFVVGFVVAVLVRNLTHLPADVLAAGGTLSTILLTAAMFALGAGVRVRTLLRTGPRALALGAMATLCISALALTGVLLVH